MLRSADMAFCDVYIQREAGFDVLHSIGDLECVQFIDLNRDVSPINKYYVSDIIRCADLEAKLIYMRGEITKEGVKIYRLRDLSEVNPLHPTQMFDFENMIDSWTKDVKDMSANHTNLKKLRSETKEIHYVLNHLDPVLGNVEMGNTKIPRRMSKTDNTLDRRQLKIITGIVARSTSYQFQTMLWRISHGTIFYREASRDDSFQHPITGREIRKVAFVIICHGDELHHRILKVCNGFNVNLYRWPEKHEDRLSTLDDLSKRMQEMDKVLQRTKYQRTGTYRTVALEWERWMTQVMKAKAIYHHLNLFNMDITSNTLIGQCWVPERKYDAVESAVESTAEKIGARAFMVKTINDQIPPTYYRTNKFTYAFQSIISSYQVGRYKELNPGLFTVVSFPFFFGVMFGDVGHGLLLILYALWMINVENKYMYRTTTNEIWNLIFKGRYMILMMGLFAVYMGFLYNEWFSLHAKLMAPYWLNTYKVDSLELQASNEFEMEAKKGSVGFVYKYGFDPGLKLAVDGLRVESSVKMKLSIILGTAHVIIGLLLNLWNIVYFKKYHHIFLNFLPKLVFVLCIFGFLVFLIYDKWLFRLTYPEIKHFIKNTTSADMNKTLIGLSDYDFRKQIPDLMNEFLHFVLWYKRQPSEVLKIYNRAFKIHIQQIKYQESIKVILYHIAFACIPVMLLGSPIYCYIKKKILTYRMERKRSYYQLRIHDSEQLKKYQEFNLGGCLLHRLWRTMEFGLGIISHVASYLRLWALSLAHNLLTHFVYDEILRTPALSDHTANGIWKLYLTFFIWMPISLFFLVIMDGLAVFIHSLRLHWIEFMSKYFKGDGVPFKPFDLSTVLDERDIKHEEETATIYRIKRARESAGDYY